jgi:hypothetical protein
VHVIPDSVKQWLDKPSSLETFGHVLCGVRRPSHSPIPVTRHPKPDTGEALMKPANLKPIKLHRLVAADAGFAAGDIELFFDGIHAFQVGKQQSTLHPALDNDSVLDRIEAARIFDGFRWGKNIHGTGQKREFFTLDGEKSGVASGCADAVVDNFMGQCLPCGLNCTDTASEFTILLQRDKSSARLSKLVQQTLRRFDDLVVINILFYCYKSKLNVRAVVTHIPLFSL